MDLNSFLILLTNVVATVGMVVIALWLMAPKAFRFLEKWKHNKNPRYFSSAAFCFFVAFSLLSFAVIELIRATLKIETYFSSGYERLVIFLFMAYLLLYLLIPKTLSFFQKWRSNRKVSHFSLSALFASISIYAMLVMYLLYLPTFLR